jgi:hypothetical protein
VPATPHSFISRRTVRLQGHRQRGIWILRDGKIAVWETAFNVARADRAGGVASGRSGTTKMVQPKARVAHGDCA